MTRKQLRVFLRKKRRQLSVSSQRASALQVKSCFCSSYYYRRAKQVAVYLAADGEVNLEPLIQQLWKDGKSVYLPVLATWPKKVMYFQQYTPATKLEKGRYGLLQPRFNPAQQKKLLSMDLVLMPLVGFDAFGNRLGMGGGFYDRALQQHAHFKRLTPQLIGVAHSFQEMPNVGHLTWDVPLNAVLTEKQLKVFTSE